MLTDEFAFRRISRIDVRALPIQIEHRWQDIAAITPPLPCADYLAVTTGSLFLVTATTVTSCRSVRGAWSSAQDERPCDDDSSGSVSQKVSEATRRSNDPQCYWQPPRRRLPSPGVLVCRRHFRVFRRVADTSPPRAEGNHPNPCLPLRARPLPRATKIRFARGSAGHSQLLRNLPQQDIVILFCCRTYHANSHEAGAFETGMGLAAGPPRRGDAFTLSKVGQLSAAIAPRGFVLPKHLNLMSSDAGNRAWPAGLMVVFANPDDAVAQCEPTSHCSIHDDAPRIDLLTEEDRRAVAR